MLQKTWKRVMNIIANFCSVFGTMYFILKDYRYKARDLLDPATARRNQVVLITGASRGIGFETLKILLKYQCQVIAPVRDVEGMKRKLQKLEGFAPMVDILYLDLSSMESVRLCAEEVLKRHSTLNILVNNAATFRGRFKLTEDGFENQLATNYLGHFYLTHLLMDLLKTSGCALGISSRIVNVSSCGHFSGRIDLENINMVGEYYDYVAYCSSKLAQLMSTKYLSKIFETKNIPIECYAVNPGVVTTDMLLNSTFASKYPWFVKMSKTPEEGCISTVYCCLSSDLKDRSGIYVENCEEGFTSHTSRRKSLQNKLHRLTCDMLNVQKFGNID